MAAFDNPLKLVRLGAKSDVWETEAVVLDLSKAENKA